MFCRAWHGYDPELQLLLACSQIPADQVLIRNLCGQVNDWQRVIAYASWHELTSIAGYSLISYSDALPPVTFHHFTNNLYRTARQNLFLCGELLRIVHALSAKNIRAIPYKGPLPAICGHGNLALRNFCDLDILVAQNDVPQALEVMLSLGYEAEYRMTAAQEARYLRAACEYNFFRKEQGVQVEIHWDIVPRQFRLRFDFDRLWSRTHVISLGGDRLRMLSREDSLLALAVHGFKHMWERLKWVCDIAILLSIPGELDWGYLVGEADRIGALSIVLLALSLANQLLGSSLSESIQARISRGSAFAVISNEILRTYTSRTPITRLKAAWLTLRTFSGLGNRASYIRRLLLDPSVEESVWEPERSMNAMRSRRVLQLARRAIAESSSPRKA